MKLCITQICRRLVVLHTTAKRLYNLQTFILEAYILRMILMSATNIAITCAAAAAAFQYHFSVVLADNVKGYEH
jgi:hypothetical protein